MSAPMARGVQIGCSQNSMSHATRGGSSVRLFKAQQHSYERVQWTISA